MLLPELLQHLARHIQVGAGEDAQADVVRLLLSGRGGNAVDGLAQAQVVHVKARIPHGHGHQANSLVVSVQSRLGQDHSRRSLCHMAPSLSLCFAGQGSRAPPAQLTNSVSTPWVSLGWMKKVSQPPAPGVISPSTRYPCSLHLA